ncbi:hypothetical protein [Nonomuraea longicatena]|uniref:Uncharacterized protein n=1 Tax=Nonomuraea longicatena TaxID=83682 RepID=A0ABP4BHB0_9ACTN
MSTRIPGGDGDCPAAARLNPGVVYAITDAPARTAPSHPHPPARMRVRLAGRALIAVAVLLVLRLILPDGAYGGLRWLAVPALAGWTLWPVLTGVRRVLTLLLGAADALIAAALGTRRLVYLAALLRHIAAQAQTIRPARPARPTDAPSTEKDLP